MNYKIGFVFFVGILFLIFLLFGITVPNEPEPQKTVVLFFDDGWESQYSRAYSTLKMYNFKATFAIITNTSEKQGYMTKAQIQELARNDMEIASHSHTHPLFLELSKEEMKTELELSKQILENLTGKEVKTFIMPYDKTNSTIDSLVLSTYQYVRISFQTIWITNQTVEEFTSLLYDGAFLVYHDIKEGDEYWATSPNLFYAHMKYLYDNNWNVVSFEEQLELETWKRERGF